MYKIIKGITPPERKSSRGVPKYPLNEMKVGECFEVPTSPTNPAKKVKQRLWGAAYTHKKKHEGREFTVSSAKNKVRMHRIK